MPNRDIRMKVYLILLTVICVLLISFSSYDMRQERNRHSEKMYVLNLQTEHKVEQELQEEKNNQKIVDMILSLNPKVDKGIASIIAKSIKESCEKYELSEPLVVSLMFKESAFNPLSISSARCIGLLQINPVAHPKKVKPYKRYELFHIEVNISIGCQILSQYIKKKGSVKGALINYLGAQNQSYLISVLSNCIELQRKFK